MLKNQSVISLAKLSDLFEHLTIYAFFEKLSAILGRKRVFTIDKAIVEVIVQYFMFPAALGDY